ncbi:MAG: pectinesterase family protein [Balneolaceae bacterium]
MKTSSQIWAVFLFVGLIAYGFSATAQENISYDYVVAQDGSGDFESIQAAIDATKAFPDKRVSIFIKNGVYKEKVKVHSWNTELSLVGEDKEQTIITFDDYFDKINLGRNSTFHTYTLLVQGNDFHAENLTIENSAGEVGQAVALHVDADRVSIANCRLLGNQDTLYISGEGDRQYFRDCYIEGTTDFIFGGATAVFEDCIIHSKKNSYITAASTPETIFFGMVFLNSELTADENLSEVFLGRPWRDFAKTVFIQTEMGDHIIEEGWHNWSRKEAEKTAFFAEYKNSGPGFAPGQRVEWSHQLTDQESEKYTPKNILGDWVISRGLMN